jgi:hypothetical protein
MLNQSLDAGGGCLMPSECMNEVHLLDVSTSRCSEPQPLLLGRRELSLDEANNQTPRFPPNQYLLDFLSDRHA